MNKVTERPVMQSITANAPLWRKVSPIAILLALLFVVSGMYSCKSDNKAATQTSMPQPDTAAALRDSLQSQVNAARLQVDGLSSKSAALDSEVRLKDAEIAKLEKERKQLGRRNKALAGKLKKDGKMIASLKDELSEKDRMYAEKIGLLQADKDNLSSQLSDLMHKYKDLKALGSVLHASDISIEPLHVKKRSKREKLTHRARKLNILRIHFDIDENRIAEDGMKELYLVIDGPDGKLLSDGNKPGELTTYKGNTIGYSVLKEISLKQNEPVKDVTVDLKQDGENEKGDYNIAIYNGGYKIGAGSVALK